MGSGQAGGRERAFSRAAPTAGMWRGGSGSAAPGWPSCPESPASPSPGGPGPGIGAVRRGRVVSAGRPPRALPPPWPLPRLPRRLPVTRPDPSAQPGLTGCQCLPPRPGPPGPPASGLSPPVWLGRRKGLCLECFPSQEGEVLPTGLAGPGGTVLVSRGRSDRSVGAARPPLASPRTVASAPQASHT